MKKLFAILLAVMMIASLAACSPKEEDKADQSTTASETAQDTTKAADEAESDDKEATTSSNTDTDSGTASAKHYDSLQDYYDDPVNVKGFDDLKKSGEGVMNIEAYVEDSTLVYDYTYIESIDESKLPSVKETLDKAIEASVGTFTDLKKQMQEQIDEEIGIKIIYRNADESIITEKEI